jgi:hypothetical protein
MVLDGHAQGIYSIDFSPNGSGTQLSRFYAQLTSLMTGTK